MNIVPADRKNIKKAADIIRSGGIVAFPTETVYGLGADAFNPVAVSRIFEAKKRPFFDPLIVHIAFPEDALKVVERFGEIEERIARKFWPGPLTIVLPKLPEVPDLVTAGLGTVAIRMPADNTAKALIAEAGTPIAAPSANLFSRVSPTKAKHVLDQLGNSVDLILDGGPCRVGLESTIIRIEYGHPVLLRPGGIPSEEIENEIGRSMKIPEISGVASSGDMEAPGQMPYHYAPVTPLAIIDDLTKVEIGNVKAGLLAFKPPVKYLPFAKIEILSGKGDLREAAANLFSCMHNLDSAGLDMIFAEKVPENGLGKAIMDRLIKAANRKNF